MTKININSFALNTLMAKLVVINRNYDNNKDVLLNDRQKFDKWIQDAVNESFEFEPSHFNAICSHLSLFLLGNADNKFSQLIAA